MGTWIPDNPIADFLDTTLIDTKLLVVDYWIPDNPIADFLDIKLIDTKFFILDYWSGIHIITGGMFAYLFSFIPFEIFQKYGWLIFLSIIVAYEVLEIILRGKAFDFETHINIVWDIIFGMASFLIVRYFIL